MIYFSLDTYFCFARQNSEFLLTTARILQESLRFLELSARFDLAECSAHLQISRTDFDVFSGFGDSSCSLHVAQKVRAKNLVLRRSFCYVWSESCVRHII